MIELSEKDLSLIVGGDNVYPVVCKNMKNIRHQRKITQQKMAMDMMIDQSTLSKYESCRRNPDLNYIIHFCSTYGLTVEDLFRGPSGQ
ncbi:helix-turn-helix domain-containing protein [Leuconostoc mesenteroides]|uniref:helix-turn-helix domain-containing protein n=1 Tax=Leuconostoc mesenteroides TaxID=1245 RepID=UPI0021A5844C|nr:helix-turn-helix transcriptional regulator [Leuconostoc mesenteroides]MCT3053642.1 XRE family transcriptional regulator [Leuconostoc mesenteroides]